MNTSHSTREMTVYRLHMMRFIDLLRGDEQPTVLLQPGNPCGPQGIRRTRAIRMLPDMRILALQRLPGGKSVELDLTAKRGGIPEQALNRGLLPLPELGRGRQVGWIHETIGMHHRGRASHARDDVRSALGVGV